MDVVRVVRILGHRAICRSFPFYICVCVYLVLFSTSVFSSSDIGGDLHGAEDREAEEWSSEARPKVVSFGKIFQFFKRTPAQRCVCVCN